MTNQQAHSFDTIMAEALHTNSDPSVALARLREWLDHSSDHSPETLHDARMLQTVLFALVGDYTQALESGLQAIDGLDPERRDLLTARYLHAVGRTYAINGMFDSALKYLQRARELALELPDPITEASVYLTLSLIYTHIERDADGQEVTRLAVSMPTFDQLPKELQADHMHDLALMHFGAGDLEQALHTMERALALNPDTWNLATYASIIGARGNVVEQRALLDRALAQLAPHERQPEFVIRSQLGRLLIATGDQSAGIAELEKAIAISGIDIIQQDPLLEQLAQDAASRGDYQRAYSMMCERYQRFQHRTEQQERIRNQIFDSELRIELAQRDRNALLERNQALEATLAEQQRLVGLVSELSTPLLPVSQGVLILPVIGTLDSDRVGQMVSTVLHEVEQQHTRALLLDVTGMPLVDTQAAAALLDLARAVGLLGCRSVLVGIRPEIAQTLVGLGVVLNELTTRATIAEGLAAIGLRVITAV